VTVEDPYIRSVLVEGSDSPFNDEIIALQCGECGDWVAVKFFPLSQNWAFWDVKVVDGRMA
jgi:hypothetical protein